ncbi:hypothetical protein [Primorskyibacter sp. S87]|uniref:hypothetical protein n=1 Tax=Primorskyibacter sp. S87 TaxID=3415126 RepID=UPI003C7BE265
MSLQAVNLGLPKTGTTTLAKALRLSGLSVADHRLRGRQVDDPVLKKQFVADVLYRGYFATGDPLAEIPGIGAISEMSMLNSERSLWPQCDFALISAIRTHHPGVKFLASWRDPFTLSQSMLGWNTMGIERLPASAIPGLPSGYGETTRERVQWIEGHYATLSHWFRDDPDFLLFDIADPTAPEKIGAHLGRDLPWWGQLNANPDMDRERA